MTLFFLSLFISCTSDISIVEDKCPAEEAQIYYQDNDGDGYGDIEFPVVSCEEVSNASLLSGDCDDTQSTIHPAVEEICNGIDDNCDSIIDDAGTLDGFLDLDGDGFGNTPISIETCELEDGIVFDDGDCDDNSDLIHPNAIERCDGVDWDCDGGANTSTNGPVLCDVLIYEGHASESRRVGDGDLATFSDIVVEEGGSGLTYSLSLEEDINPYTLVLVFYASISFTDEEVLLFSEYIENGGTLVLVGENGGWGSANIPVYNELLTNLEIDTLFLPEEYDGNCYSPDEDSWIATAEGNHPLIEDVSTLSYAYSSNIDLGTSGIGLIKGESDQWLFAEGGGVFLLSDATLLMDHCEGALREGNLQFFRNLFHYNPMSSQ